MLTIDKGAYEAYPDAKMGILAIRGVNAATAPNPAVTAQTTARLSRKYGHLDRAGLKTIEPICAYVDYYKKFGYSYHVLAQLESVLTGKRALKAPSAVLSAMFETELESMLLTAGHDLDQLQLPLSLQLANGGEVYQSISGKSAETVSNDLMVASGGAIISSILRGPDYATRITPETSALLFTVYAPGSISTADIEAMLRKLETRIRSFAPASRTEALCIV